MCEKHKNYRGVSEPKHNCINCWKLYLAHDTDKPLYRGQALRILQTLESSILTVLGTVQAVEDGALSARQAASAALYVANYGGSRRS